MNDESPTSETDSGILAASDPPAFEIVNPAGAAPLLLLCDHASHAVPRALAGLGLDDGELRRHIGWDIGAADVTRVLAERLDAPAVFSGYSRLVIDCNRALGHPTSIPEASERTVIPGNRHLSPDAASRRAEACFWPYHRAVRRLIEAFLAAERVPAVLAVHSFTGLYDGLARPWHIGVLWDRDPRISVPLIAALRRRASLVVGDNEPYSGSGHYGYSIETHATALGFPNLQIEFREDLIRAPEDAARWANLLADDLAPILADPALYRREHF